MKKLYTLIAFILSVAPWSAYAATQTMSACTTDAWDTAYAAASNGDIIAFPAGECSVTMTKAIAKTGLIIQGAGTTNTTVTGGFTVSGSAANGLKITGIKFLTGPAFTLTHNAHQVPENIRITGNLFSTMDTATFWGTAESSVGAVPVSCVVDNNTYDSMTGGGTANYVYGDCDSTTGFPFTLGTSSGVYFEDNTVTNAANMGHFVASRCASRYVVRYNSFGDLASWDVIDAHDSYEGGGRENGLRGSWTFEVYNNKFAYGSADKRVINLRGGQGVVFNNFFSQAQAWNPIKLTSYNICNEICAHDDALCSTGGWNDHINATYVWGNKANCGADLTNCAAGSATSASNGCLSGDPLYPTAPLVENTDYTLSAMPGYTAYAYPHPLTVTGTSYTQTPSGTNCTVSPSGATTVAASAEQEYTFTGAYGYSPSGGGTCGGTLSGSTWTASAASADCTVTCTGQPHFATLTGSGSVTLGGSGTACLMDLVKITYDGNGSDGGTVPLSPSYCPSLTATVSANTGTLTKSGYDFDGWNTAADGSGTSYAASDTFAISGNTTLYAKWAEPSFVAASGGTETTDGDYKIHAFTASGTLNVTAGGNVEVLVVAGGGGGGCGYGGGGGGGGVVYDASHSVTVQVYSITVGAGGAGDTNDNGTASNGEDSLFDNITAVGGGGGGSGNGTDPGASGGSGGGSPYIIPTGGSGTQTASGGDTGYGHDGGRGLGAYGFGAGGGGGASAAGQGAEGFTVGDGGAGQEFSQFASIGGSPSGWFGGGGGAGRTAQTDDSGTGGAGGGGNGGSTASGNDPGDSGTANTGGGGGGGGYESSLGNGGAGGSGIVIIRYKYQ